MTPNSLSDDPQTAVILERIDSLRGDFHKLETRLDAQRSTYVEQSVFTAWQTSYDREMRDMKTALSKHEDLISNQFTTLRAELRSELVELRGELSRPSQAPVWVGMGVAIITAAIALINGLVGA